MWQLDRYEDGGDQTFTGFFLRYRPVGLFIEHSSLSAGIKGYSEKNVDVFLEMTG